MELEPIETRDSAVDACANVLRRAILAGTLAPGERLPPERGLAARLGVNRVTVRSALARLHDAKLVSVRQGSGYVVRDFHREGGTDLLGDLVELAQTPGDLRQVVGDLLAVRRQLARLVLERLAAGPRGPARARVTAAIDEFEAAVAAGATNLALARADADILRALVAAAGSAVLQLCVNPIIGVLARVPALRDAIYRDPSTNLAGWRLLATWLERGDAGAIGMILAALEAHDEASLAAVAEGRVR